MIIIWIAIGLLYGYFKQDLMDEFLNGKREINDPEMIVLFMMIFPVFIIIGIIYFTREWWVNR